MKNDLTDWVIAIALALTFFVITLNGYRKENQMLRGKLIEAGLARYVVDDKGKIEFVFIEKGKEEK